VAGAVSGIRGNMDGHFHNVDKARIGAVVLTSLVEEVTAAHKLLDELGAPREDGTTPQSVASGEYRIGTNGEITMSLATATATRLQCQCLLDR
jgi:hypothetical protein